MSAIQPLSLINRTHRPFGIEGTRLEANLGAEVSGLNLAAPLTPEVRDQLRSLLWEHQVLILRDTDIDDVKQAEIARLFGEPQADSIAKRRGSPTSRSFRSTPVPMPRAITAPCGTPMQRIWSDRILSRCYAA